jgi:hypothetical protein
MKITNRKDKKKLAHNSLAVFTADALLDELSRRGSNSVAAAWGRIGGAKARKEKLANNNNNGVPAARARTRLNE